jgi:hypothetical protein
VLEPWLHEQRDVTRRQQASEITIEGDEMLG